MEVPDNFRHFIGGEYRRSSYLKAYPVVSPVTGMRYATVEVGKAADIREAVLAATAALTTGPWPGLGAAGRARHLDAIAGIIDRRAADIADAEAAGAGLPASQAQPLAAQAAECFRAAATEIRSRDDDAGFSPSGPGGHAIIRCPAGVAGLITPWRTPFLAQARAVAPALGAGCPVVLKPDEYTPLAAWLLTEIAVEARLPDGVLNVVHGSRHPRAPGHQARDALLRHPGVPVVSFAGDAAAGRDVMALAAARGKKLRAELAGSVPCVIFADADMDQAVASALFGAFWLGGQRRTATSRILAERPVYRELVSRLAAGARGIVAGDPSDPATQLGPLVHAERYGRLRSWIRLGLREGARVVAGGKSPADLPEGRYLAATVLADVEPCMRVFAEPACGPVLSVTPFDAGDDAVPVAAELAGPPAAYLWTADTKRARQIAVQIGAASTWVNSHNALDLLDPVGGSGSAPNLGFYTRTGTVHVGAEDTPVTPLGAAASAAATVL